jgi:hypothetical protein
MYRLPVAGLAVAIALLGSACTGTGTGPPGGSLAPEPPGRTVTTSSEFDREPCVVASAAEMSEAITPAFDVIAAHVLVPEGPPTVIGGDATGPGGAAGCEYRLIAEGTDSAEAYHLIIVKVVRLASGGPELMGACEEAAEADPLAYRVLDLADGACAGTGAVMALLVGGTYYSVTVAAVPGRADLEDEDLRLGTLAEAAGTLVAPRLPAT